MLKYIETIDQKRLRRMNMKIGVIQAASQIEKNSLLYRCTLDAVKQYDYEVINFGCFENEAFSYSYVEIAVAISFLPSSGAVDFVVTGCSSGQGMMLACNSMLGVLCGLAVRAQDAFLFGRINDGNAISIPLGNGFGWDGEENLKSILKELLRGPFGSGYPAREAERKRKGTLLMKKLNGMTKKTLFRYIASLIRNWCARCSENKRLLNTSYSTRRIGRLRSSSARRS